MNHIDGNKLNNSVENLEFVSNKENRIHALDTGLKDEIYYGVAKYSLSGEHIKSYETAREALLEMNLPPNSGNIGRVIRGKRNSAYGFVWKQCEDPSIENKEEDVS